MGDDGTDFHNIMNDHSWCDEIPLTGDPLSGDMMALKPVTELSASAELGD